MQACPELAAEEVDYVIHDAHAGAMASVPPDDVILVVDVTPDADMLQQMKLLLMQVSP